MGVPSLNDLAVEGCKTQTKKQTNKGALIDRVTITIVVVLMLGEQAL